MASLIPGYEYDIFISYRQKDNKGDRWVTEFVEALKTELESTFKEEISVYFDINPHDGLLETHDVDASLQDKLKCLIFIPIISRTYCDPKSFAWEHEFKAFVKEASQDQFGLKIKLPNGNVANRMIPVQIHDLYPEDKALIEKELGGFLRAVEFIYKEPGVNRPLTASDEKETNLNKTFYKNQINKVANVIDEVIHSLHGLQVATEKITMSSTQSFDYKLEEGKPRKESGGTPKSLNSKKWMIILLSSFLLVAGAFEVFKIIEGSRKVNNIAKLEKSIAVLPFVNDSPVDSNKYFINGIMDEILNNLQKVKNFRVLSRTSVEKYRGQTKLSIPEIAKELNVNFIVEGSGQKYGNKFRLRVQLIAARNEKHLWGESYEKEIIGTNDIFKVQSEVAQSIASELETTITPEEKQLIERTATTSLTAYDYYQRGNEELVNYYFKWNYQSLKQAEVLFKKALKSDSTFAKAYSGLAGIYYGEHFSEYESYYNQNYLDSVLILADQALSFDNHLSEAYLYRAWYYVSTGKMDQAIKEYEKAIKYNPNFWRAYYGAGFYVYFGDLNNSNYVKGLEYIHKAAIINKGKELASILDYLGWVYGYFCGFPEEAKKCYQEAFNLEGDTIQYLYDLGALEAQYGDFEKGIEKTLKAYSKDSSDQYLASKYLFHGQYKESLKYWIRLINKLKSADQIPAGYQHLIGFTYWQNGYKKEAEYWFNEQKKLSQESGKLGRYYSSSVLLGSNGYYDLASVYAFTGEKEKAYEILRTFDRYPIFPKSMVDDIKIYNPLFNSIRHEPEFQNIVKDMESKYLAEHERVKKWLEEQGKI